MAIWDYFFTRLTTIKRFTNIGELNYYVVYKINDKLCVRSINIVYEDLYTNEFFNLTDDRMFYEDKEVMRREMQNIGDELVSKYIKSRFAIKSKFFNNRIDYLRNLHTKDKDYANKNK